MFTNGPPTVNPQTTNLPTKNSAGFLDISSTGNAPPAADPGAQGEIAALPPANGTPAVAGHFKPGTQNLDSSYLALGALGSLLKVAMPSSKAEQHARFALESTLRVIDTMAASLVEQSTVVLESGTSTQQLAVAAAIDRFLKKAEMTMKGLVDEMVRELLEPQSPAMQTLTALVSNGMWRDIEEMQKTLKKTFETPVPGSQGNEKPDAVQRQKIAQRYAGFTSQNFRAQLDAINLPSVEKPGFDTSNLFDMAAMRQELAVVENVARVASGARALSPVGTGIRDSAPSPGSSTGSAVANGHVSDGDDAFDLDDKEDDLETDEPAVKSFDPNATAQQSDQ